MATRGSPEFQRALRGIVASEVVQQRPPSGPIDVAAWNAAWESFFTALEGVDEAAALRIAEEPTDAHRRVLLKALNVDLDGRAARRAQRRAVPTQPVVRLALRFGPLEDVAVADASVTLQFTTALAASQFRAYVDVCGIPAAGLRGEQVATMTPPNKLVVSPRLVVAPCSAADAPPIAHAYVDALFSALGAESVTADAAIHGATVNFADPQAARVAVHVLQQPLLWQFGLGVSFAPAFEEVGAHALGVVLAAA